MKTELFKNSITLIFFLCFATTISAEYAEIPRAQKPDPRAAFKAKLIERYDKNKNGKLDKEEIETISRDRMLENDRNKDGRVDPVELKHPNAGTRKLPPMDALELAMSREEALADAREQREKERLKTAEKPIHGQGK
jgi:hypothetical protein